MTEKFFHFTFKIDGNPPTTILRNARNLKAFAEGLLKSEKNLKQTVISISQKLITSIELLPQQEIEDSLPALMSKLIVETLADAEIVRNPCFSRFLADDVDRGVADEGDTPPSLQAIDFLLMELGSSQIYIPRCQMTPIDFDMTKGSSLIWRFSVDGVYDIGFVAIFKSYFSKPFNASSSNGENVSLESDTIEELDSDDDIYQYPTSDPAVIPMLHGTSIVAISNQSLHKGAKIKILFDLAVLQLNNTQQRVQPSALSTSARGESIGDEVLLVEPWRRVRTSLPAEQGSVQGDGGMEWADGSFTAPSSGVCRLLFDNRYSTFTGKYLELTVQIVNPDTMKVRAQIVV